MLDVNSCISFVALVITFLAAIYARWASEAAKKQNDIAIHNERLKIYKAFLDFRVALVGRGYRFDEKDLWIFYEQVNLMEFYYTESVYKITKEFWDAAYEIAKLNSLMQAEGKGWEGYKRCYSKISEILVDCRDVKAKSVEDAIRNELKIQKK